MSVSTQTRLSHKWEEAGLGHAPYRLITCISLPTPGLAEANPFGYRNAMSECALQARQFGVSLGSCDYCSTPLINNYVVRDRDRKHFVIGCDCVQHCGDSILIDEVKEAEKRRIKAQKAARAKAEREARESDERTRNGGKTDAELRYEEYQRIERERHDAARRGNQWLIDFLVGVNPSPFVEDMIDRLNKYGIDDLSARQQDVLCEIYCRGFRGYQKDARRIEFFSHIS